MEFNFQLKKNMKSILVLWVMLFIHEIAHKIVHHLKETFHYKANLFTLLILSLCTSVLTLFVMCNYCAHLICKQPFLVLQNCMLLAYSSRQKLINTYIYVFIFICILVCSKIQFVRSGLIIIC